MDELLEVLEVLPLDVGVDTAYARIRDHLESVGRPIGGNDCLIAAHAQSESCVLVTANLAEFRRVPNLSIENWLPAS